MARLQSIRSLQEGLRQLLAVKPSEGKKTSFRYIGFFGVRSARTEAEDESEHTPISVCYSGLAALISYFYSETKRTVMKKNE